MVDFQEIVWDTLLGNARKFLEPINYEPETYAFYVEKNGVDLGEGTYCEKCVKEAVKNARKSHRDERSKIVNKYNKILKNGFYREGRKKIEVTEKQVKSSMRYKLKEYPARASFTFCSYDPSFSGGKCRADSCDTCGRYFDSYFSPDLEEAGYLLDTASSEGPLDDSEKWLLQTALNSDQDWKKDEEVRSVMVEVVHKLNDRAAAASLQERRLLMV